MDRALLRLLRTRGHAPGLERAAALYAHAGENGVLWFALAVMTRNRRAFRLTLVALVEHPVAPAQRDVVNPSPQRLRALLVERLEQRRPAEHIF